MRRYDLSAEAFMRRYGLPAEAFMRRYDLSAEAFMRRYGLPAEAFMRRYGLPAEAFMRRYDLSAEAFMRRYGLPAKAATTALKRQNLPFWSLTRVDASDSCSCRAHCWSIICIQTIMPGCHPEGAGRQDESLTFCLEGIQNLLNLQPR